MVCNNNMLELNKMLTLLSTYSIINYDTNTKSEYKNQIIRIHSLTQCFLESNHKSNDISNHLEEIVKIFIKDLNDCQSNNELQDGKYWLNHFYKIYENEAKKPLFLEFFSDYQVFIMNLFDTRGIPYKTLEIIESIEQHQKEKLGADHPSYLATKHNLALCYSEMNQLDKACKLYEEVEQADIKVKRLN